MARINIIVFIIAQILKIFKIFLGPVKILEPIFVGKVIVVYKDELKSKNGNGRVRLEWSLNLAGVPTGRPPAPAFGGGHTHVVVNIGKLIYCIGYSTGHVVVNITLSY